MLALGYAGERHVMDLVMGCILGMAVWFYIFFETFSGETMRRERPFPCPEGPRGCRANGEERQKWPSLQWF